MKFVGRSQFLVRSYFRFLFNCGDGTQRIIAEQKMKLSRFEHIFITRRNWKNFGGLMGMSLSLDGLNIGSYHLHGPPNVEHIVAKNFFVKHLEKFNIVKHEISEKYFQNEAIQVQYLPIYPCLEETDASSPVAKKRKLSFTADKDMSTVYVLKPTPKLRAVSLMKCIDAGVERGPMIGELKNNKEVTLPDGKVIHPEDVLEPGLPSGAVIVLECPSKGYVDSLVNNERLKALQSEQEGGEPVVIIVHMTPQDILELPRYQDWMKSFGESTRHLILNESCSPTALEQPYVLQKMLNKIHSEMFPLLFYPVNREKSEDEEDVTDKQVMYGETGLTFIHRPDANSKRGFSKTACLKQDEEKYVQDADGEPLFLEASAKLKKQLENEEFKQSAIYEHFKDKDYPEIVFLGTGSAIPSKGRNVSAILVHTSPDSCMLLDVGENTEGQIYRHYGPDAEAVFRKLNAVYVSHLHADHHMGLVAVAQARRRAYKVIGQEAYPLEVFAPEVLQKFFKNIETNLISCNGFFRFTALEHLHGVLSREDERKRLMDILQLSKLNLCRVRHIQFPHGLRLDHKDGWSLSYSGDTMPCDDFAEMSKDVDIMIHEATMEDEMIDEAREKRHSTTSQAIEIGKRANAKFLLLTHFSQRYAKVPFLSDDIPSNIGIAFDNMRVKPKQLALLPLFLNPLRYMFPKYMEEMAQRTNRRRQVKELEKKTHRVVVFPETDKQQQRGKNAKRKRAPSPNSSRASPQSGGAVQQVKGKNAKHERTPSPNSSRASPNSCRASPYSGEGSPHSGGASPTSSGAENVKKQVTQSKIVEESKLTAQANNSSDVHTEEKEPMKGTR